jgi:hypothetical protein
MPGRSLADRGSFHFRDAVWLSLLGSAVYFGVMYAPIGGEYYEVRALLQKIANNHWRPADYDAEKIKDKILAGAKEIGETVEFNEGKPTKLAGLVLLVDDIFVNRDDEWLTVQVKYTRYIKYPFLNKSTQMTFRPMSRVSTKPIKY